MSTPAPRFTVISYQGNQSLTVGTFSTRALAERTAARRRRAPEVQAVVVEVVS